ncbi:MAG: alpha/beta fold hydrolase [Actinomycetota bacterium]
MTHFVLVPSAWLPGDVFAEVGRHLAGAGHHPVPVTLPGIGHAVDGEPTLDGWIDHVVGQVTALPEHDDVVLAGHSFSGLVVGPAAAKLGARLRRLVFIDANVPEPGRSFAQSWSPAGQAWLAEEIERGGGSWPPDLAQEATGLDDDGQRLIEGLAVPMPAQPLYAVPPEPSLPTIDTTYLHCTVPRPTLPAEVSAVADDRAWSIVEIEATHWPMICGPRRVAEILAAT